MDDHTYDSVNLQNLNVLLHVPIFSKAGAMPVSVMFYANSYCTAATGTWQCGAQSPTVTNFGAITANNFLGGNPGWATAYPLVQATGGCTKAGYSDYLYSQWVIREANGTLHPLPPNDTLTTGGDPTYCIDSKPFTATAVDGSGLSVTIGNAAGGYYVSPVVSAGGLTINQAYPSATSITDPNNNVVSVGTTTYDDTLGLVAATASPSVNAPTAISWTNVNGSTPAPEVTVNTANVAWQTNFGCSGINDIPAGSSQPQFSGLSFPDGTSLSVTYEPSTTGHVTGRIGGLTIPTGGTVSYSYTMNCSGQVTKLVRTTSDGTTTYTTSATTTSVTDQGGNNTTYFWSTPDSYGTRVLTQKKVYLGSSSLLSTTTYCYNSNTSNCSTATVSLPIKQMTVQTTVGTQTRQSAYTYDAYGNVLMDSEYDFGASNPTTTTTTVYGTWNSGTGACGPVSSTINNRPCRVTTVYNPITSPATVYQAEYTYDGFGNLTSKSVWTGKSSGTQWLTSTATYNSNGTVATSHDAANNLTTYNYTGTGGCDGVFPISVESGSLTTYYTWNCTGGVVATSTDANGNVTTYGYENSSNVADPFWRLRSVTDPLGNEVWKTYYPSGPIGAYTETAFAFGSSVDDEWNTVDGYGRPILFQKAQSSTGSNYDTVSTGYGWSGNYRSIAKSIPCSTTSTSSCTTGITTTLLDPLGRPYTVTDAGTGVMTTTYPQNDVLSVLSPAPSGENVKQTQTQYDGLGRPTSSCVISSTPVSGSVLCNQKNGSYNGVLTTTSYSAASGSQTVTSIRGSQTRSKTVDALGRVISSTTPEGGAVSNYYDTVPSFCVAGNEAAANSGKLIGTLAANGNFSCYDYDALGRVVSVVGNYSAGGVVCRRFYYDNSSGATGAIPSGITISNPYGRMVEAESDTCAWPVTSSALITDEWFSYDADGHMTDMWESTPHSGMYYHSNATFYGNGVVDKLTLSNPNLFNTNYALDGEGRWNQMTTYAQTIVPASGVTYNAAGQPKLINIGTTGDNDSYTYDSNTGRMTNWQFTVATKNESATLNWNPNGTLNNLAIIDGFNSGGTQTCYFNPTSGTSPGYDDLGRLLNTNCGSVWTQTFSYDQYDNITKTGSVSWACASCYNASTNQYNGTLGPVSYDNSGNLLADTLHTYTWNAFNKLGSVDSTSCGANGECITYDAFGRAVETSSGSAYTEIWYTQLGKTAYMNGATFNYAYWPTPGGGTLLHIHGTGGYAYNYQHKDWLGNSRISSNLGPAIIDDRAFAPYGEIYNNFGSTNANENIFTGDTQDILATTDCCFDTPNRELSATQGRWLSPDPAGAGWNLYAYATNPNSFIDPTGLNRAFPGQCEGGEGLCAWEGGGEDPTSIDNGSDGTDFSAIGNSSEDCPICGGTWGEFGTAGIAVGFAGAGAMDYGLGSGASGGILEFTTGIIGGQGTPDDPYLWISEVWWPFLPQGNLSGAGSAANNGTNCQAPFLCNPAKNMPVVQQTPSPPQPHGNYGQYLLCVGGGYLQGLGDPDNVLATIVVNAAPVVFVTTGQPGKALVGLGAAALFDFSKAFALRQQCTSAVYGGGSAANGGPGGG